MDFHEFPTIYSVLKQNGLVDEPPDRFYSSALALIRTKALQHPSHALAVEHNRTVCEWDWIRVGSPYFKVYPAMIPLLSSVGIDVPVDYLRLPFPAFAVRLPAEDNPLVIDDQYYVRAILVCDGQPLDTQERRVYLWIDVGERAMENSPVLTYCQLECVPGIQIEDAFNRLPMEKDIPGVCVPRESQARCLRLVVSVSLLATGADRLVEPDNRSGTWSVQPVPDHPAPRVARLSVDERDRTFDVLFVVDGDFPRNQLVVRLRGGGKRCPVWEAVLGDPASGHVGQVYQHLKPGAGRRGG